MTILHRTQIVSPEAIGDRPVNTEEYLNVEPEWPDLLED
jgi:hypothetical protein